jgi:bacteriocin biosynthesis cyclodehydratase domain-containing protein
MTALARTSDVIVDATGHPIANHLLSEIGRETGKPVISAAVFAKGSGGFVLRQDATPTSPCYACLHHLTRRAASDDTATMDQLIHQYGFTPEELDAHVGLYTDANLIAAFLAKALLDLRRRDPLPTDPNLWIIDNALATVTSHRFRQNPTCPSCHPNTEEDDDATTQGLEVVVKGEPS